MTKTELTQWFEDEWWPRYLNFVKTPFKTQWGAGAKGKALTKFLQVNPSEDLRTTMLNAIIAQTRHRRLLYDKLGSQKAYDNHTAPLAKGGEPVYQNRQGSTYLFNRGWTDEIPALDMGESESKTSKVCQCGQPVHGPQYDKCTSCLPFKDGKLTGSMARELRLFYYMNPEVRTFDRSGHIAYIKRKLSQAGRGGIKRHDGHVRSYYIYKYSL
jgi:hypothetical protein